MLLFINLYTPLLQLVEGFGQSNTSPAQKWIVGGVVVGFIILLIIMNAINKKSGGSRSGGRGRASASYSRMNFRRDAKALGLTKSQIKLLEHLIRNYHVSRPFDMLKNSRTLNNTLGKAVRDLNHIQAPPKVQEQRKLDLYRIKQRMERLEPEVTGMMNTREMTLGQKITFQLENGKRYNSIITANLKEFYCARIPTTTAGDQIRWKRGDKIFLYVWNKSGEEQLFISKVMGYNSVKKITSVILSHTKRESKSNLRRFRRKKIQRSIKIFPIRIVENHQGRRITKQAVVEQNQGRLGSMVDLSAGGCCLTTTKPLKKGDLVKLNFEPIPEKPVATFGKVVDISYTSRVRANLHIQFTKASSRNLNRINAFIYEYE